MDKPEITYTDTWYKVDSDTGERTEIEQPQPRRSSSPVDDFLENFLENKVIAFGKTPEIIENVKEMQRKWIIYITELHAFEDELIDDLKSSLPNNDEQLIENHKIFFTENKPYQNNIGLLRSIGLDYLTELKTHLNQFKKQTGGRKKRKKSKHRKRRKSLTKRRKKAKKRKKSRLSKRRKSRRKKRRKSRRTKRRKKRGGISSQLRKALLKKHKTIKKRPIKGSNFFKELVEQEKKIKKLDKNGLFLLIKKVKDDTTNLTPEERLLFMKDSKKFMTANTNEKKINLIYLLATWLVFIEGRKNKIIFFKYNSFPNFLKVLKAHGQVYKESQASARTSQTI